MSNAPTSHFQWAPSSASRWLACHYFGHAEIPEVENVYGGREEGSDAHKWAADVLLGNAKLQDVPADIYGGVSDYVNHIRQNEYDQMFVEKQWESLTIDNHGGTMDCLLIAGNTAVFYDYKNGRHNVEAENNVQLLCYAGIADDHFEIDTFYGVIVQPNSKLVRGRTPKVASFPQYQVKSHKERVLAATQDDSKTTGDHCLFCPLLQAKVCDEGRQFAKSKGWIGRYKHLPADSKAKLGWEYKSPASFE